MTGVQTCALPICHLPEARFINLYGPTEITCNCTWHEVERGREYPDGLPIGRSFPNERVFLLDEENHLVTAPGMHGEICVTGTALALGYYNNPTQTESRFVQNPLVTAYPQRMYRTGDLGWYNEEGELFFAGRKDFQIKYMGHRIELEEIERALSGVEGVERACCVFDEKKGRLTAYYVGEIEGKDIHRIFLNPYNHIPLIRERAGRYGIRINESIAGLMKMAVSDEMICFTYSAESYAKANKAGFISNEILCFNWKGGKIKKYLLPFPISTFCVDKHFIYGVRYIDDESIIYRFKL